MKALIGEGDLFSGLAAHLALHHEKTARLVVLPIPDGRIEAVPGPGGIEVGVGAVAELVKPRTVGMDDEDRALPFDGDGIVLGLRKQTSMLPVLDQDGLKSMWPVVSGFPSGRPTSLTWISPLQKHEICEPPRACLAATGQQRRPAAAPMPAVAAAVAAACVASIRNLRRVSCSLGVFIVNRPLVPWYPLADESQDRLPREIRSTPPL